MTEIREIKKKEKVIEIAYNAALQYRDKLCNNNFMFVYKINDNSYDFFEAAFLPRNFKHLTGIKTEESIGSVQFYNMCLGRSLKIDEFELSQDGTTLLKSDILLNMMSIHHVSKCVGEYNGSKPKLITEKISGHMGGCMGFELAEDTAGFYVPNTIVKEPVRDLIKKSNQLVAVFEKRNTDKLYSRLVYRAKKIDHMEICKNSLLDKKIDTEELEICFK